MLFDSKLLFWRGDGCCGVNLLRGLFITTWSEEIYLCFTAEHGCFARIYVHLSSAAWLIDGFLLSLFLYLFHPTV